MSSTIQAFRYALEASFLIDSENATILTGSIQNLVCKYDYESKHMPIIYLSLRIADRLYDSMVRNIDKGSISLTLYKFIQNESIMVQKEIYFRSLFSYFIPQQMTFDDETKPKNDVLQADKDRAYKTCTIGLFDMTLVNNNARYINLLFRNSDMLSIVHYCTSHMNMVIEPFKDHEKLDFCFTPPNLTINKLLQYLNSVHSFYNTGFRYFNEFKRSYLLSTSGNPVNVSDENYDTVILRIMDSQEYATKIMSMEIDRTQRAYIMYIDMEYVDLRIDHLKDKQYQKIIGVDTMGETIERDLNIPTHEENTEKIWYDRIMNGNMSYINTIKDNIESSSVILNIVKGEIDSSIISPNKEYLIKNPDNYKEYNGRYILAYKRELFVRQSDTFALNTVFGLRRIMD
ncbi:MAG: hypothetical protein PHC62_00680 [Candidatus Izemoplasmatales bacterium]|nr:hypothetical protein [Candidatus Izemoplasmatales bacterium]